MKQAILITAYTNLAMLQRIIDWFDMDFDFYIHIDRKCSEDYSFLSRYSNVHVYSRYRVTWGSDRHLMAILCLINHAAQAGTDYSYVHLITGADFPIKSPDQFRQFFNESNRTNYMEFYSLPHSAWMGEGGLERLRYYWIGHRWVDPRNRSLSLCMNLSVKVQRKLHYSRNLHFVPQLYGGGTYWSLTGDAVRYLAEQMNAHRMRAHFMHTHIAEEIWAQTLLLNAPQFKVENDYKRFMRWIGNAASPTILTEADYDELIASPAFFARKFVPGQSDSIMDKLANAVF